MIITDRRLAVNHEPGRRGLSPDMLVIHVTEGSAASVRSWFNAPEAEVSAHYMVTVGGEIDQFVKDEDTAWHAGRVDHPVAPLVVERPHINPNLYSLGIEHEGTGLDPMPAAQRAASLELVRYLSDRWNIPLDRRHIVAHREIFRPKSCPGAINVDVIVAELTSDAHPLLRPVIVWSNYLNDYLVVTRMESDTAWEFVPMNDVRNGRPTRGTVPLSAMPLVAP